MKVYERFLGYGYEGFLLFLCLMTIAMFHNEFPPILGFITVFLLVSVVLFFYSQKNRSISYLLLFVLMVCCAFLGWVLGLSPVIAVLLSAACCQRAAVHFFVYVKAEDRVNGFMLLLFSIFYGLFLYIGYPSYSFQHVIFFVVALQLIYLAGVKILDRADFPFYQRSVRSDFLRWAYAGCGVLILAASLLTLIYMLVRHSIYVVFGTLLKWILALIAYPIYLILQLFNFKLNYLDRFGKEASHSGVEKMKHEQLHQQTASHFPHWIGFAILIAAVIVVVWYLIRKTSPISAPEEKPEEYKESSVSFASEKATGRKKNKVRPPSDEVRRLFFQLQGALASYGFGRRPYEPVNDWFSRLDLDSGQMAAVASGYRKVRYGKEQLSDVEKNQYERAVQALMREAKENRRKED